MARPSSTLFRRLRLLGYAVVLAALLVAVWSLNRHYQVFEDYSPTPRSMTLVSEPTSIQGALSITTHVLEAPEVTLGEGQGKSLQKGINELNHKRIDGFIVDLIGKRKDLSGMPFIFGNQCQVLDPHGKQLLASWTNTGPIFSTEEERDAERNRLASQFWESFRDFMAHFSQRDESKLVVKQEYVPAMVSLLMQVLGPHFEGRAHLVNYLGTIPHRDATRGLAKLAVFSEETVVRRGAIEALLSRPSQDYTDILLEGLRYPWPQVAQRSCEAIVKLKRKDLLEDLVKSLEEPDPRLPKTVEEEGKKTTQVREVVRIQHNRNCMLCHPPGNSSDVSSTTPLGVVPIPGQPRHRSYRERSPSDREKDILVRVDVTYLRQDFSLMLPAKDPPSHKVGAPAGVPEMERFDYLVRTREVSEEEAQTKRAALTPKESGAMSPYQHAICAALREFTGRSAPPNAEAWRRVLGLPSGEPRRLKKST